MFQTLFDAYKTFHECVQLWNTLLVGYGWYIVYTYTCTVYLYIYIYTVHVYIFISYCQYHPPIADNDLTDLIISASLPACTYVHGGSDACICTCITKITLDSHY